MGGHGGLNILPQKSWHVYNRDNKQKVLKDEAKHAEEQEAARQKNEQAEREFRRQLLLNRARHRGEAQDQSSQAQGEVVHALPRPEQPASPPLNAPSAAVAPAQQSGSQALVSEPTKQAQASQQHVQATHSRHRERTEEDGMHGQQSAVREVVSQQPQVLQHINFFSKEEAKLKHEEEEAERRAAKARRGNPDTQTSDARFDEKFQFAHNLHGKAAQPWYARPITTLADEPAQTQRPAVGLLQGLSGSGNTWGQAEGAQGPLQGPPNVSLGPGHRTPRDVDMALELPARRRDRKSKKRKEKRKRKNSKSKKKHRGSDLSGESSPSTDSMRGNGAWDSSDSNRHGRKRKKHVTGVVEGCYGPGQIVGQCGSAGKRSLEQLRLERLAREQSERDRQHAAVQQSLAAAGVPLGGKKYHSAFGNMGTERAWHGRR